MQRAARASLPNAERSSIASTAPFGFPREHRLVAAGQYQRVFSSGQRSADRWFAVVARGNEGQGPRLGLTVAKKAARKAVERNRIKRVAREVFRQSGDLPALDFVVMARPLAARSTNAELSQSLQRHFRRLAEKDRAHG